MKVSCKLKHNQNQFHKRTLYSMLMMVMMIIVMENTCDVHTRVVHYMAMGVPCHCIQVFAFSLLLLCFIIICIEISSDDDITANNQMRCNVIGGYDCGATIEAAMFGDTHFFNVFAIIVMFKLNVNDSKHLNNIEIEMMFAVLLMWFHRVIFASLTCFQTFFTRSIMKQVNGVLLK